MKSEWGGSRENAGAPSGTKNGMATVPFETVDAARKEWENRPTMKTMSAKYGVSIHTLTTWLRYNSRVES